MDPERWNSLLYPYIGGSVTAALLPQLETYLDLLLRWNQKMNLTAIRNSEDIIRRHFGESLFVARHIQNVPRGTFSLLDHGSGAGFPGLPIALARPELAVTLSESQQKKAAFLREVVRSLGATNITVHAARTEALPAEMRFQWVTLRAVDDPDASYPIAAARVAPGGGLMALESARSSTLPALRKLGLIESDSWLIPNSESALRLYTRSN
jgi:16S rRNA (guanine527-N7)-methyltransferase